MPNKAFRLTDTDLHLDVGNFCFLATRSGSYNYLIYFSIYFINKTFSGHQKVRNSESWNHEPV